LSCLRRAARPEDAPPPWLDEAFGGDVLESGARLGAESGGTAYWVLPTGDGQAVWFVGVDERGGSGGMTTLESLRRLGAMGTVDMHRGRWGYALLVADGYERARAGTHEAAIADNVAVLHLPDRERYVRVHGPAGSRTVDLGRSEWDEFSSPA
jgi:hypothetical protein